MLLCTLVNSGGGCLGIASLQLPEMSNAGASVRPSVLYNPILYLCVYSFIFMLLCTGLVIV